MEQWGRFTTIPMRKRPNVIAEHKHTPHPASPAGIDAYWRAANYLGAAQLYLRDNVLLEEPLSPAHIKPRILGHWGTQPGINLIYAHLNRLICDTGANIMLVVGPGHGAPAVLANLYLEGTLHAFEPALTEDRAGLTEFVRRFSWPGGAPSHITAGTPGAIHEGGELGYSLAHAFGAAFDQPDLIVACIVGDGEAETGPLAASWHSNKFLDPATSGAVLPILHLNGVKLSAPTIMGAMSESELDAVFSWPWVRPAFRLGRRRSRTSCGPHYRLRPGLRLDSWSPTAGPRRDACGSPAMARYRLAYAQRHDRAPLA